MGTSSRTAQRHGPRKFLGAITDRSSGGKERGGLRSKPVVSGRAGTYSANCARSSNGSSCPYNQRMQISACRSAHATAMQTRRHRKLVVDASVRNNLLVDRPREPTRVQRGGAKQLMRREGLSFWGCGRGQAAVMGAWAITSTRSLHCILLSLQRNRPRSVYLRASGMREGW